MAGSCNSCETASRDHHVVVKGRQNFDLSDGAAIILQGITAHYLVHEFYPIKRGSTVLVHTAAGEA